MASRRPPSRSRCPRSGSRRRGRSATPPALPGTGAACRWPRRPALPPSSPRPTPSRRPPVRPRAERPGLTGSAAGHRRRRGRCRAPPSGVRTRSGSTRSASARTSRSRPGSAAPGSRSAGRAGFLRTPLNPSLATRRPSMPSRRIEVGSAGNLHRRWRSSGNAIGTRFRAAAPGPPLDRLVQVVRTMSTTTSLPAAASRNPLTEPTATSATRSPVHRPPGPTRPQALSPRFARPLTAVPRLTTVPGNRL